MDSEARRAGKENCVNDVTWRSLDEMGIVGINFVIKAMKVWYFNGNVES